MDAILRDLSEPALIHAIEANLFETFRYWLGSWSRMEFHDTPDLMWGVTDIAFPLFNPVMGARLADDATDQVIAHAIERCKARNIAMLWWTGPTSRPLDLGDRLTAHGFKAGDAPPGMAADLHALNQPPTTPPGLSIRQVTDEETLKIWSKTCIDGFEMPDFSEEFTELTGAAGFGDHTPMRLFIAWLDDQPVATSLLFLGAGVAGIYNVATLASARGHGAGSAVTLEPLLLARDEGYRVGILQSSEIGYSVYRKLGFQEYCQTYQYIWSPDQLP
jgi:GNAT superfamily N-acetyltransferase